MKYFKTIVFALSFASLALTVSADIFFDNGSLYQGQQFIVANGQQIGNEVAFGSGITLTNFEFEYYSPDVALNSSLGIDVRFYLNDGPVTNGYSSPGTLIYDSGFYYNTLGDIPTGTNDWSYAYSDLYADTVPGSYNLNTGIAGNYLPSVFTYTITFTNLGANTIEIPLAGNTAGVDSGSYWLQDSSGYWSLLTNSVPANFVSQFAGTVPEPSMLALGVLGGALLVGAKRLRRKP